MSLGAGGLQASGGVPHCAREERVPRLLANTGPDGLSLDCGQTEGWRCCRRSVLHWMPMCGPGRPLMLAVSVPSRW